MSINLWRLLVAVLLLLLQGCTTLDDAKKSKGEGVQNIYRATLDGAWDASVMSLMMLNLEISEHSKNDGYILAKNGVTAFSYGENIAIFLRPAMDNEVEIEVVSKPTVKTNLFAPNWSASIHEQIRRLLTK